jgi:cytidine deaminase
MKETEFKIRIEEYNSVKELNAIDQKLIDNAKEATSRAYSPYSGFSVGAAIHLDNGEIVQGNNQENAAYPSGLCAERVAMFYANSKFPDAALKTIAVAAKKDGKFITDPVTPCGSCRQALLESEIRFDNPIRVLLIGEKKIYVINGIKSLLPLSFGSKQLKNS